MLDGESAHQKEKLQIEQIDADGRRLLTLSRSLLPDAAAALCR